MFRFNNYNKTIHILYPNTILYLYLQTLNIDYITY